MWIVGLGATVEPGRLRPRAVRLVRTGLREQPAHPRGARALLLLRQRLPRRVSRRRCRQGRALRAGRPRDYEALCRNHPIPGRLLDIGAAAGFFVKTAQDRGWRAEGIELSPDTAALAREQQGVAVQHGRLEDVEFPAASFDAVTLWDVIEHVRDPLATCGMRRVARLVRPGGTVGLLTPNLDGLYPKASYKVARLVGGWPCVEPPGHLFQFSTHTLTDLLCRAGFVVVDVQHENQPVSYSFGSIRRDPSVKRIAYKAAFAPLSLLGPRIGAGDEILVIARRTGRDPD